MPPRFSVVMVTFGAWPAAEHALSALAAATPEPHEVIVVDNASPDATPDLIAARFARARLVRNPANAGFGPASNQGARLSTAPLLCFLNSDAFVEPGWFEPLGRAVDPGAGVGAAVPCVQDLDGRVQCAGALLGRDGTVVEYGNGAPAGDPAVAFPRAVDFGPAACLVVDRAAFLAAGGFRAEYAPAYYEDADLCLTLAERGLRTVYVPGSRVRHVRYASGGSAAAAALSARNRARFVARWAGALEGRPATLQPPTPRRVLAARDAGADGRVLVAADALHADGEDRLLALLALRPWMRVTFAGAGALGVPWAARGVEVLDEPAAMVLRDRPFHFDAIFGPVPGAPLDELQPQAARFPSLPADLASALASAGIA